MQKKFKLSHSLLGTIILLFLEAFAIVWHSGAGASIVLCTAIIGGVMTLYVATEVIEEVRNDRHMLALLSAVVTQSVIFFTFQYWFLLYVDPASFPTLPVSVISITLHSVMIFVFNPLYLPATEAGRALLLIHLLSALGLVLFILQNIRQFRKTD